MIKKMKTIISAEHAIWIIAALLLLLFLGLYFYIFGPASHYRLSSEHTAWASFGTYLGGTIGPIISGMAFLYVWKTYQTQTKQLEEMKLNTIREEFQRAISDTVSKIDTLLSKEISGHEQHGIINIGLALSLILQSNTKKPCNINEAIEDGAELFVVMAETSIDGKIAYFLFTELNHLCFLFDKFLENGGSEDIVLAYTIKHRDSIHGLYYIGNHEPSLKIIRDMLYRDTISKYYSISAIKDSARST